ncbi:hypothetical protein G6Z12_14205 [Clostridium perfringens]|uniref:hypothetical protein n=1 Tax=Clostridium perfringens TaxID=1502 RepID=UPI0013E396F9|nr:hypothetical protein [Clostridium perfringens]NGT53058.1 hypothetical protein [Clostridium perfringens]NGT74129.1 hypothetical protein [Clostridium perfringens]NGU22789.1 hypothetical protein [Clostridium perfringens]
MRDKEKTILKIISISCFLIVSILNIVSKNYTIGIVFLLVSISYFLIFLNQKKSNENK